MDDAEKRLGELRRERERTRAALAEVRRNAARKRGELVYDALLHAPRGAVVASTSAAGEILFVNRDFTAITGYVLRINGVATRPRRQQPTAANLTRKARETLDGAA